MDAYDRTVTIDPSRANFTAFSTKLSNTSARAFGSPSMRAGGVLTGAGTILIRRRTALRSSLRAESSMILIGSMRLKFSGGRSEP